MINKLLSWSIRTHLILFVSLLALPSAGLIVYSGLAERKAAIGDAKKDCLKLVNNIASEQQAMVSGVRQLVTALGSLPQIQSRNAAATNALLSELLKKNPHYANIGIADKYGLFWASAVPFEGKLSVADRKYYQDAARTGMFSSGEYTIARTVKRAVMNFGYPVKNASGELLSVIVVGLDLDNAQKDFEKISLPPGASFSLLDHQGTILIRNLRDTFSEKLVGKRDVREELFARMAEGAGEGTFEAMGNDGKFRLVAYKKLSLPYEAKPYLYVRSSIPRSSAISAANAAMVKNLTLLAVLYAIGLLLVWFIGRRLIVNPILSLMNASEQLAAGTGTVHVSRIVKGGELGRLARTFDGMADALLQKERARDAAETSLRESEERYRTTVASIGDAVIVTDKAGKVTFLNAEAERLTGWTQDDALGQPLTTVFKIINEQTRQPVESPVDKVLRLGTVVGLANHTVLVTKSGREIPIDDSGAPVRRADGTVDGVVLVFRDFTERKQAEERTKHLASFPELNPNPILEVSSAGEVTFSNPATERTLENLGLDEGGIRALLPPDLDAVLVALAEGKESSLYREVIIKERIFGEDIYLSPRFAAVRIYAHEITGRKLRQARITRLTKLYAMLSRVNEAIVRTHDEESMYGEVCRIVAEEGTFPLVWIGEVKERQVVPVVSCGPAADYLKGVRVETDGVLGQGPTGTCIREDRPVVNDDFDTNAATAPWREPALRYGFRASAAFPLHRRGNVVGALTLYGAQPRDFDAEQVSLLEALSADISYALDTLEHEQLRTRTDADLQRSLRRFELLAHTASELLQKPDPQKLVNSLCREVMDYLECHAFFNFLVVPWAAKLKLNAYAGIPEEEARKIEWLDYGVAVCGCAARDACRIVAEHIPTTPDPRTELVKSYGIKAYACHPLLGPDGNVIGTLSFGTCSRETFSDGDLSLMKAVADQVAMAMIRMQDEEAIRKARDELDERVTERTKELTRHANLLNLTQDAVLVRDLEDRITFWNKGAEELYGWTAAETAGKVPHDLLRTKFPEGLAAVNRALSTHGRWEGELQHTTKDGRLLTVSNRTVRWDENGVPAGTLEVDRDVTEHRQAEDRLRQAQKMEALGTLTGGIAHDFNNILAAMIGFAELAKDDLPGGSRHERHLQRVLEAGLRARDLIRQMLTFSRKSEQERKPLRLSSIVNETVKLLRASTPSTISLRVDIQSESGLILADPVQLQQVVMNLCTNAAHAMREKGGTLAIALSDFSVSRGRNPAGMEPGLYMRLVVRDTGVGMPRDIMDRIFDPFFTTKKLGEGTGLGLSVVMGIVKQSRGYITAESEPGKGSTFTVYFPKIAEKPVADAQVSEELVPTGSERILFVDDEEPLVEMGEELLAELGYEVTSRTSSREALALLKHDPSRFDLVITDQTMPEITGVDLARETLHIRPELPVILCTGFSHLVDASQAKAAGIRAFVMKPLTKREIAQTVRKVLDR